MGHEPIILDKESWPDAHPLAQYTLNRVVANAHEETTRVNNLFLHVQGEIHRVEGVSNTNSTRIAVLEAKVILYGVASGAIGMAMMHWLLGKF